jgi:hypothetical protein
MLYHLMFGTELTDPREYPCESFRRSGPWPINALIRIFLRGVFGLPEYLRWPFPVFRDKRDPVSNPGLRHRIPLASMPEMVATLTVRIVPSENVPSRRLYGLSSSRSPHCHNLSVPRAAQRRHGQLIHIGEREGYSALSLSIGPRRSTPGCASGRSSRASRANLGGGLCRSSGGRTKVSTCCWEDLGGRGRESIQ